MPQHNIKITSHESGQKVPVGNLTMHGTSSDNVDTDCQVYVDWNNVRPFKPASPKGLAGTNDYSNWTFTYTKDYHLITSGSNKLNANLFCLDNPNPEASSSINIIGQSPTKSDAGTKSDIGTKHNSDHYSGHKSHEDPFQFVVFCVIVGFDSNEDSNSPDSNSPDNNSPDNNSPDNNSPDNNNHDDKKHDDKKHDDKKHDDKKHDDNNENDGDGCGGGDGDGNDGDDNSGDGGTECKKIIDKNGNGFGDEIDAKKNELNLENSDKVHSC